MVSRALQPSQRHEARKKDAAPIRVAIVGTGGIYRLAHGPAWRRLPRADVVATCDVVEERATEARREMDAKASFTDYRKLFSEMAGEIDVVDICTPSHLHAEIAVEALRAGLHVICEKPMAMNVEDAARIMREAEKAQRQIHVGQTRRFDPRWVQLREQIMSGRIGDAITLRRSERGWGGFPAGDWHWDVEQSGGVLMDLGVHVVDMFDWLFDAKPVEVYAKTRTVRPEAKESGCPDFAVAIFSYGGDRRGLVEISWAHPKTYAAAYSHTEVIGTKGKLVLSDKDTAPLTFVKSEGMEIARYSNMLSAYPEAFDNELNSFLDCIEGLDEPRVTPQEASTAVRAIAGAFESARTGKPVRLDGGAS